MAIRGVTGATVIGTESTEKMVVMGQAIRTVGQTERRSTALSVADLPSEMSSTRRHQTVVRPEFHKYLGPGWTHADASE